MKALQTHPPAALPGARERILQTAHDLFYRDGIRATGVDRIIAEASVSKATFYRHFPGKNDLIAAYLDYRHVRWLHWFKTSLATAPRQARFPLAPVVSALQVWFNSPEYRGCAFINGVVELGTQVAEVSLRHKQDMVAAIATLLPLEQGHAKTRTKGRAAIAQAAALAVDGAIINAQMTANPAQATAALATMLRALCDAGYPAAIK